MTCLRRVLIRERHVLISLKQVMMFLTSVNVHGTRLDETNVDVPDTG